MYDVIKKFCKICEYKKDEEKIKKYDDILKKLKESLNTIGWDGQWFKRAYFKNKAPLRFE